MADLHGPGFQNYGNRKSLENDSTVFDQWSLKLGYRRGRYLMSTAFKYSSVIDCVKLDNVRQLSVRKSKSMVINGVAFR